MRGKPSLRWVIVESVVAALLSVIVTKLAARALDTEIGSAVLGGIAAGVVAIVSARRLRAQGSLPQSPPVPTTPVVGDHGDEAGSGGVS